jgi:hypothetical protein
LLLMQSDWNVTNVVGLFLLGIGIGLLVIGFSYGMQPLAPNVGEGLFAYTGLPLMEGGTLLLAIGLALSGLRINSKKN